MKAWFRGTFSNWSFRIRAFSCLPQWIILSHVFLEKEKNQLKSKGSFEKGVKIGAHLGPSRLVNCWNQ